MTDFIQSDQFDHLVKFETYLDFSKNVPVLFVADSPVSGDIDKLFEIRDEIRIKIPFKV